MLNQMHAFPQKKDFSQNLGANLGPGASGGRSRREAGTVPHGESDKKITPKTKTKGSHDAR